MNIDRPIQMHNVILAIMVIADLKLNETPNNEIYNAWTYLISTHKPG